MCHTKPNLSGQAQPKLFALSLFTPVQCFSSTVVFRVSQYVHQKSRNNCNSHKTADMNHTPDFRDASDSDTDLMSLEDSACEDHETDSVGTGRNGNGATQIVRMAP